MKEKVKNSNGFSKLESNAYLIILICLALVIGFLGGYFLLSAQKPTEKYIKQKTLNYIKNNILPSQYIVKIIDSNKISDTLYALVVGIYDTNNSLLGAQVLYATSEGKYMIFGNILDMDKPLPKSQPPNQNAEAQTKEIPKTNKPKIELFVMSHCPYGIQMEKAILPVLNILKDKIDFELKFVDYAMHGEVEVREQVRQYCIQKEQKDKFLEYLACFVDSQNSDKCLESSEIDKQTLEKCIEKTDNDYNISKNLNDKSSYLSGRFPIFLIYKTDNEKYNVQGSPTLIINGVAVNPQRTPQAILTEICKAFIQKPNECEYKFTNNSTPAVAGSCG
ncbi:MAG: hypothetical protein N3D73_01805 [Candidatus Diapherotrites archaeon]|nr:hypothetical protein [Candidatus Diapherotrites archaeon]